VADEGDAEFRGSHELSGARLAGEGQLMALLNDAEKLAHLTDGKGPLFPEDV